jgi:hypothetical protein
MFSVAATSYDGGAMAPRRAYEVGISVLLVLAFSARANAHCEVGNRVLTATLTIDDPCVEDELSLPTIAWFKTGNGPSAGELDISGEYSKTITENFGVSLDEAWIRRQVSGEGATSTAESAQPVRLIPALSTSSISISPAWNIAGRIAEGTTSVTPTS